MTIDQRDLDLGKIPLACPLCRRAWLKVQESGAMGHRRVCYACGLVLVMPRAPLVRAIRKAAKRGRVVG